MAFSKGSKRYPTSAEVREFGQRTKNGDVFENKWQMHQYMPFAQELTVVHDVPRRAFFILEDQDGKTVWMRTRTLMRLYTKVS